MDVGQLQNRGHDHTSNDVNVVKYANTYSFLLNGKRKTFTTAKTFLKLFPQTQQTNLKTFYQNEAVRMDDPWSVARWVGYALSTCIIP